MRVYRIRVTGHHPERFGKYIPKLRILSHLFRLGDTFEVYAVKEPRVVHKVD